MNSEKLPRGSKTIRIPFDNEEHHTELLSDSSKYAEYLNSIIEKHPELFPRDINEGFDFYGKTQISKKLGIRQQRIRLVSNGALYSICPSFVMPYMSGFTKNIEKALFAQRFGVPYWGLTYLFGKNDMYWYRIVTSFGRNSIVGTTVKNEKCMPEHLVADEKITQIRKDKAYVPITAGGNCILGATVCQGADEKSLTEGYGEFVSEAKNLDKNLQTETVNTDGWKATEKAWKALIPTITIIRCFLHAFISIRDRCRKKLKNEIKDILDSIWNAYHAENKRSFAQRIRRLREKAIEKLEESPVLDKIIALCDKTPLFSKAYDHPNAHRTSNMVDRLMRWSDQYLFNMQYFHGTITSAKLGIRSWAILRNFQPYCTRIVGNRTELVCAAEQLNGFKYSNNWLENLLISSSMGGYRQ